MTPQIRHRRQLVARLQAYPHEHRLFLELTRQEYYQGQQVNLPRDSVASARIDGMPQAQVGMISNPTLRIVISRETIRERLVAQQGQLDAAIQEVADRLTQFWDWWFSLNDVQQSFVQWRWWDRGTYEQVARYFLAEGERFYGYVPDSVKKVMRYEDELLADLESIWYRGSDGKTLAGESTGGK